jgi:Ni,Fe-hydrogenase I cytochrome b subunit
MQPRKRSITVSESRPRFYAPLLLEPGYRVLTLSVLIAAGFYAGYQFPRDVELETTKPIEFRYEVTPEAAKYLVQKAFAGCPTSAD